MARTIRTGDVASAAATNGAILQALLMPIIVALVAGGMKWLTWRLPWIVFPDGYQLMASGAIGAGIIKVWMWARLRAHYALDQTDEQTFERPGTEEALGIGGRPFRVDPPLTGPTVVDPVALGAPGHGPSEMGA